MVSLANTPAPVLPVLQAVLFSGLGAVTSAGGQFLTKVTG